MVSVQPQRYTFEVQLPLFQGPLDLLLHLIEKNELDITKIALARVTNEFLEHVDIMRQQQQVETIADFLVMAARLLYIKSRALLPAPPPSAQLAESMEEDAGDELVRHLRAYRRYKEAAQWLRERDGTGLRAYIHVPSQARPQRISLDLSALTLDDMRAAAQSLLFPSALPAPQDALQRPRITVVQQIRLIRQRLLAWADVTYKRLLSQKPTRVEAVVTLQAILELIKQSAVTAHQPQLFADITVQPLIPPDQIPEPADLPDSL